MRATPLIRGLGIGLVLLVGVLLILVRLATFHPPDRQRVAVTCPEGVPVLSAGQAVKIMTWNVQYMSGKNYVFFFDVADNNGPDERPSAVDIGLTLDEVGRVIREESPDVVLLQEIDDGAARTDRHDQLALLLDRLAGQYPCHCSAFYWKAWYVPHPRIHGSVGMKLSILSKYRIAEAARLQLGRKSEDFVTRLFSIQRAVLEARMPVKAGKDLVVLDTHLEAFAQGTDTLSRQVSQVKSILEGLTAEGCPWVIGGDFNLLPPGKYTSLPEPQRVYFNERTEISPLFEAFQAVPSLQEIDGPDSALWFTHFPNDPSVKAPDRTIDYLFMPRSLALAEHRVRQQDTLRISDHFPVVATIQLPGL
jgi:endonuclease/exonuclease/phosphatase family metal-dependent hydrolase